MIQAAKKSITIGTVGIAMLSLSACASMFAGTSREITVTTEPPAATCDLNRNGARIGFTDQTPNKVRVSKSKRDITVNCKKPGYNNGSNIISSEFEPWTLGNILLGGVVGMAVDMSTGAYADYPAETFVRLTPAQAAQAQAQPQAQPQRYTPQPYAAQSYAPQQAARPTPANTDLYQQGYGSGLSYSDRVAQYGQDLKRINDNADSAIAEARAGCLWGEPLEWIGDQDAAGCEARVAEIEAGRNHAIDQLDQKWRGTYMQ